MRRFSALSITRSRMAIVCKSPAEIEKMRRSGRVVRQVLDHLRTLVAPGATTMDLERAAEQKMKDLGAKPAFKGYYDYPCVLCTSINEEIVHGIPSEKRDAEGRRHRFHRLRRGARRLLRRCSDHGAGGRASFAGVAEAAGGDRGVAVPGHREGAASAIRSAMLARPCRSTWRPRFQRGARVCWPRDRNQAARGAAGSELRLGRARTRDCAKAWCSRSSRW